MAVNNDNLRELIDTISQVWRIYKAKSKLSFKEKSATILQHHSMRYLRDHPGITLQEFSLDFQMSASAATQFIERLVRQNFVIRKEDKEDRRKIRLFLGKKGEEEIMRLRKLKIEKMKKLFEKIPENDLKEFLRICKNLLMSLKSSEGENE